jgi:hypothetical protein
MNNEENKPDKRKEQVDSLSEFDKGIEEPEGDNEYSINVEDVLKHIIKYQKCIQKTLDTLSGKD